MPSTLVRKLNRQLSEIAAMRALLANAAKRDANQLSFTWIGESLDQIEGHLRQIDPEKIEILKQSRTETRRIFEQHVAAALKRIDQPTSGLLTCARDILENAPRHSAEVLRQVAAIHQKARWLRKDLWLLQAKRRLLLSWRLILLLFLIAAVSAIVMYVKETHVGSSDASRLNAVQERLQVDTEELSKIASNPEAGVIERIVEVTGKITQLVELWPALIAALASLLAVLKGIVRVFDSPPKGPKA